jgi:hypothetical protein
MAAAALTIAVAAAPSFVGQSQAASAKKTSMANPDRGPGSVYCNLAKSQRNAPSWNEYYGCLKTPARQAYASAPPPAPARAAGPTPQRGPGSEYCKLAKSQRNAPSWNEYYGCLRR